MDVVTKIAVFVLFLTYVVLCGMLRLWLIAKMRPSWMPPPEKLTLQHWGVLAVTFMAPAAIALGFVWFTRG